MNNYIERRLEKTVKEYFQIFPVTALLGPRQCGKSTLARRILSKLANTVFLDLEDDRDLQKLSEPALFFEMNQKKLICIDEIQRRPDLFPILRSIVDKNNSSGQLLILGSASRELLKQSSESLAGRIGYLELTPFLCNEPTDHNITDLWLRGGFPRSLLAESNKSSFIWRKNFIQTYLERDLPLLGFNIPASTLKRLWIMLAHSSGHLLNSSQLGKALGVSHTTLRKYVDLLCQTYMVRLVEPYIMNTKKRLIKTPKLYIRDSGILHCLLGIENYNELLGHPIFGFSWEGFVVEQIFNNFSDWETHFYRTADGSEMDIILTKGDQKIGVEVKASTAPKLTKGFWNAISALDLKQVRIIVPIEGSYPIRKNVIVSSLNHFLKEFEKR